MKQAKSIDLSGDGRCYSTGYNTKYLTFSFFHFPQRKLPRLEILTEWITTARHVQIRKYLKKEEPNITHQFDVWYFSKNIN